MTRFFWLDEDAAAAARYKGDFNAAPRWFLPGVECSGCGATWSASGHEHPSVDLSQWPGRVEFEEARPEPFPEFARLRELVRPLAPPGAELAPGTSFGPMQGSAFGQFGPFTWQGSGRMLVRREALERLQAEGLRGLQGVRTGLRFRQKNPPELMELELQYVGRLHPDCLPPDLPPPCATCGRTGLKRPDRPILDAASLPSDLDLFRLGNFAPMIIGTERFRDTILRLDLDGIAFRELPTR